MRGRPLSLRISGWFTRATNKPRFFVTSAGHRKSGCGSAAAGPFEPVLERPRGMICRAYGMECLLVTLRSPRIRPGRRPPGRGGFVPSR
jgi:hypothetical protein